MNQIIPAIEQHYHKDPVEVLGSAIVNSAFLVHKGLGPGLLEKIYETCFCYELDKAGIPCERQVHLPVHYDGLVFDAALRIDVLVGGKIICELKARREIEQYWTAQILSHMKMMDAPLGYLINFNVALIKDGIKRFIL